MSKPGGRCPANCYIAISQVYFGFTHCPDICPEELDKLSRIIDLVAASSKSRISTSTFLPLVSSTPAEAATRAPLLPLFITCDPARDTPAVLKHYLSEFHLGIVGLTGSWEQVKDVCKKYRVYFSTPPGVQPGMDYLVDHSIYFYLMGWCSLFLCSLGRCVLGDFAFFVFCLSSCWEVQANSIPHRFLDPEGDFIEAIGRQHSAESAAQIIREHMSDWKNGKKR